MAYVRNKTFKLTWDDDTEFAGLEVRAKSMPVGAFMQVGELMEFTNRSERDFTPEDLAKIDGVLGVLADALVSWNLEEEDGTPVPATREGLYAQDFGLVLAVAVQWMAAVASISADLGKGLTFGGTSPEGLELPMEPLSSNQGS